MALHRAQILLEPDQHVLLEKRACESRRSMSDLVREIIDEYFTRQSAEEAAQRSLAALDALAAARSTVEGRHGALGPGSLEALLDGLRQERDADLCAAALGDREVAP